MTGFAKAIRAFAEKTDKRTAFVVALTGFEVTRRVQAGTPVDKGTARFNWYPSKGTPNDTFDPSFTGGAAGAEAAVLERASDVFQEANTRDDAIFYVSNNAPYIVRLENGWSSKGSAFYANTVLALPGIVEVAIKQARRRFP